MLVKGILTQMSGSLGGITAAHNAGGLYLRARTIPTDPGTFQQIAVRTIFGSLANHWQNTLSAAQRTAWDTYGENVSVVNRLGDTVFLSGFMHYIRSNTPRIQAGAARVDDGPTIFDLGEFTNFGMSVVGGGSTLSVTFDSVDAWANEDDAHAIVLASREVAPTINFFKGPYQFAGTIDGDALSAPTSPASITSPFSYASGNKGFAQVRISRVDGRLSALQRLGAIAS